MRRLSLICLAALAPAFAMANIIPTGFSVTGSGPYVWTYNLQVSQDQKIVDGLAPTVNPVSNLNDTFGSLFTIYDFDGYVAGTCTGPAGWACTAQNVGFTPSDVGPVDDAGILNLTWAYTEGPDITGDPSGVNLGNFSAQSRYSTITTVSYAGRGLRNGGELVGTIGDNVGLTIAPNELGTPIPEPGSLALAGLGLAGLALVRRRRKA